MKSETKPKFNWRFEALGTYWEISSDRELLSYLCAAITNTVDSFDKTYSRFRSDSLVSNAALKGGAFSIPNEDEVLFEFYEKLYVLTDGKVTPLVGDTLEAAGYDAQYSLKPQLEPAKVPRYEDVVQRSGADFELSKPVMIDLGAAGKGYLVDRIVDTMLQAGHVNFIVDASGDMRVVGKRIETVGLEDPHNTRKVIGAIKLQDKALCASASNRRAWGDWHHVIDPSTSLPSKEVIATWVVADSAMLADGLATALFFTAPKTLAATYNYEYLRMHANGSIEYSEYFAKGVFK